LRYSINNTTTFVRGGDNKVIGSHSSTYKVAEQGPSTESKTADGPSGEEKEELDALSKSVDELKQQVAGKLAVVT
jgi:hypothetical protein